MIRCSSDVQEGWVQTQPRQENNNYETLFSHNNNIALGSTC